MSPLINEGTDLALRFSSSGGQTLVLSSSPLTRLNYFDGKFLRADDLRLEQAYVRQLVQYSNQGLGAGVVYGMDTTLDNQGRLNIGPGVAMDSNGQTLIIPSATPFDIGKLIDASRRIALLARTRLTPIDTTAGADFGNCIDATTTGGTDVGQGTSLYLICIGHAESLCGTEDVFGRLCEEACITATDRPLIVEGVIVRALPLTLRAPLATSKVVALGSKHLRSLVASAYFEDERHVVESLISRAGLSLDVWCMGAEAASVGCVPLGVIARSGTTTLFLDAWTARRERIEAPARRYWAWRMAMRPWDVFLAQILQFQCQLHELIEGVTDSGTPVDPCDPQRKLLDEASGYLKQIDATYAQYTQAVSKLGPQSSNLASSDSLFQLEGGATNLASLRDRIDSALKVMIATPVNRVLITGGIVELPSAGYLPVTPGTVSVNTQVRRLMGEGVDLRFCVVRPDFVAHALEEAQHMERISLLTGLDDPNAKPEVDILVPNGDIITAEQPKLAGFDTQVRINSAALSAAVKAGEGGVPLAASTTAVANSGITMHGAGRGEGLSTGGGAFYFAGGQEAASTKEVAPVVDGIRLFAVGSAKTRNDLFKRASGAPVPDDMGVASAPNDALVARYVLNAGVARQKMDAAVLSRAAAPAISRTADPALISMWATARSDRDPYSLSTADSTSMSGEIVVTSQVTSNVATKLHFLVRFRVFGTFTVKQLPVDTPSGRRMVGHLSGTVSTQTMEESNAGTNHATPFDADVVLIKSGDVTSARIRASLSGTRLFFTTDVTWGGTPLSAYVKLSMGINTAKADNTDTLRMLVIAPQTIEILAAKLVASDDALKEGSALRLLSTSAIELIGEELSRANQGGPAFVDAAQRSLFPPPPAAIDDLTVRPTMDWVLFHRRRTKRCATPAAAPPTSPTRRYQVYEALAAGPRVVADIRAALRTPGGIANIPFKRVDVVEFAGGLATLLSSTDALLQDWNSAQPGNRMVYGAIATPVPTDTQPLEDARLARVVQALSAVSSIDAQTGSLFETIPQVPAALAVPGTDGIIFLVTETAVVTTCQDVYRIMENADVLKMLLGGDLRGVIAATQTTHIASVEFDDDSPTPTDTSKGELQQAWTAAGGGTVVGAVAYPNPSDSSGGSSSLIQQRALAIVSSIGPIPGPGTIATRSVTANQWPTQGPTCPVVTFVIAQQVTTARVVANRINVDGASQRIGLQNDVVTFVGTALKQDAGFAALVKQLQTQIVPGQMFVSKVEVATRGAPDASASGRLSTTIGVLEATTPPVVIAVNVPTPPPAPRTVTAAETPVLDETGTSVDALVVITISPVVIL